MKKQPILFDSYFTGTLQESRARMPETVVNDAIKALSLNPNEIDHPTAKDLKRTIKEALWDDLITVFSRWGQPSPTTLGITPNQLKKHSKEINKILQETLDALKWLEYEPLFTKGTQTKEFIIANRIRQVSEIIHAAAEGRPCTFVAPLLIKQEYEGKAQWEKHYPFDHELEATINGLEKIVRYTGKVSMDAEKEVRARGTRKKGKDNFDHLIYGLCIIYKQYTGEFPMSWNTGTSAPNAGKVTGKIIPFLQAVLPYTFYNQKTTPEALQKRILRIRSKRNFADLWADTKK